MGGERMKLFAIIGQWFAGLLGVVGLTYEIATGAHFGYILITACGVAGYVFTKIRHEYRQD